MSLLKKTNRFPFLLDDFLTADWLSENENTRKIGINVPAVNIKETDDNFSLELAVPGLTKKDFFIELDRDTLSISSQREIEKDTKQSKNKYTRKEFNYQSFKRSFTLPESANGNEVKASYENGVLWVVIPKKEEAKIQPKRLIDIE